MKIKSLTPVPGLTEAAATDLFDKIEKFAGYGFNKSHAVAYTLISYQSMWLKVKHPSEFYAAALSVLKEEKLIGLISDAREAGIEVLPPDINHSSDVFEILTDTKLLIPFSRAKQISDNVTTAILAARGSTPFTSKAEFIDRVERSKCNVRHVEVLTKVGAFNAIEPTLPRPDIKDLLELLPGLVLDFAPVTRLVPDDPGTRRRLIEVVTRYKEAHATACKPLLGKRPKFMVVADAPTWAEEQSGQIAQGKTFSFISESLHLSGLERDDAYWTSVLKAPKLAKVIDAKEVAAWSPILDEEIEILRPPVILCLGGTAARHFVPDLKGNVMDHAGRTIYDKDMDATIVIGFNPAQIAFDGAKQEILDELFAKIATMVLV